MSTFKLAGMLINDTMGTFGFVTYDPTNSTIVVAFRGSDDLHNWLDDFLIVMEHLDFVPFPNSRVPANVSVHMGFLAAYVSLQPQVLDLVLYAHQMCGAACNQVVVTGHSLGAAMAGFGALDLALSLAESLPDVTVSLVNFGMPRIGNEALYDFFRENVQSRGVSWRVVHYNDIVPQIVPRPLGYHHVATEQWNDSPTNGTIIRTCDGSGEDPTCADSLWFWEWSADAHMWYLGRYLRSGCPS